MARPARHANVRPARSLGVVTPGQWVVVPVTGDPFPAQIRVGHVQQPALIDFEGYGAARTTTLKVRCPQLPPGDYDVLATHAAGFVRATVTVV